MLEHDTRDPLDAPEHESRNRTWLIVGLVSVVLVALIGTIVWWLGSDGDGEQLSEAEFFQALDVLDDEYATAMNDLEADFFEETEAMDEATPESARIQAFANFTEDGVLVLEDFIDGIAELDAPDELTGFQDRAVRAGEAAIESLNDVVAALSDASTEEELEAVVASTQEPFDRLNASCVEAQALADDAGIDVEYDCE